MSGKRSIIVHLMSENLASPMATKSSGLPQWRGRERTIEWRCGRYIQPKNTWVTPRWSQLVSEAPLGGCRAWLCSKNAINDIPPDL